MILDGKMLFWDAAAMASVITSATSFYSDTLDFGAASRDPGMIHPALYWNLVIGVDAAMGATGTLLFILLQGSTATPTTTGMLLTTPTFTHDEIEKGITWSQPIPVIRDALRYMRVKVTCATDFPTAGTMSSWLGLSPVRQKSPAVAIT